MWFYYICFVVIDLRKYLPKFRKYLLETFPIKKVSINLLRDSFITVQRPVFLLTLDKCLEIYLVFDTFATFFDIKCIELVEHEILINFDYTLGLFGW